MGTDGIELAMAFEGQLLDGGNRFPEIKLHLTPWPRYAKAITPTGETEIVIYALHHGTAFFLSLDGAKFGVGRTEDRDTVVDPRCFPTLEAALRAFAAAVG
jgi:hypothetical protein